MNPRSQIEEANVKVLKDSVAFRYFSEKYPSFLVFTTKNDRYIDNLKLPLGFLLDCSERIPRNITVQLLNGHDRHVHYQKSENLLCHMSTFVNECKGIFGSINIYSYVGKGKFSVSCLKDDLCEVIYFKNRTIPRSPVYDQDLTTGVGWNFLVFLNHSAIQLGQIPLPGSFWRPFGKYLTPTVNFFLRNGKVFQGVWSMAERKMIGITEIIATNNLNDDEKLLFTYLGGGNFFVMVIDRYNIENLLEPDSDDSDTDTDSEDDVLDNVEGGAKMEVNDVNVGMQAALIDNRESYFSSTMTASNVDNTCHGSYIPPNIKPTKGVFEAGDRATLRIANGEWEVGIVLSNGTPRFSGGWNKFARDNLLSFDEIVEFSLQEEGNRIFFDVGLPGRG